MPWNWGLEWPIDRFLPYIRPSSSRRHGDIEKAKLCGVAARYQDYCNHIRMGARKQRVRLHVSLSFCFMLTAKVDSIYVRQPVCINLFKSTYTLSRLSLIAIADIDSLLQDIDLSHDVNVLH